MDTYVVVEGALVVVEVPKVVLLPPRGAIDLDRGDTIFGGGGNGELALICFNNTL